MLCVTHKGIVFVPKWSSIEKSGKRCAFGLSILYGFREESVTYNYDAFFLSDSIFQALHLISVFEAIRAFL